MRQERAGSQVRVHWVLSVRRQVADATASSKQAFRPLYAWVAIFLFLTAVQVELDGCAG